VAAQHPQLTLEIRGKTTQSLANFVVGPNQAAVSCLRRLIAGDVSERFIYLWGASGTGRSHLLSACRQNTNITCIDDCQHLSEAAARDAFVAFTESLSEPERAIVAAGDRPAGQLGLRSDLQSRLTQALSFELKLLPDSDLRTALALCVAERGIQTSPDVVNYLLNRLPRNMTSLTAAFDALDDMSLQRKLPISLALARELLGNQSD
jgi:DnaA-homolog protein